MSSALFALGKFFLLEYIYSEGNFPVQFNTSQVGFKKIVNNHKKVNTMVNADDALTKTYNIADLTAVELSDGRFALLDNDAAYYYPAVDPQVTIDPFTFQPNVNIIYDTIRLHIISGYNFPDNDGALLRFDIRQNDNVPLLLANLALLKTEKRNLFYNPRPIRISQFIYDRFWEVKIPSQAAMLDNQLSNPGAPNTLASQLTNKVGVANQFTIYVDFRVIRSTDYSQGVAYFTADSQERFALASRDAFGLLVPTIALADDGDYFRYGASYDTMSLEDFMFSLNSMAGNDYIIYHELRVSEQIGNTYTETDNITSIQTDNYNTPKVFVPLIKNSGAVSFAIDYVMRLYNRADGRSIFKSAAISSMDVNKFGKKKLQINVGNTLPVKVYNKLVSSEAIPVKDLGGLQVQTKYVPTYIDTTNIVIQVDDDALVNNAYKKDNVIINIYPFDNHIRFNILRYKDGQVGVVDLSGNKYYLAFKKDDDKILRVEEELSNTNKGNGELIFKIPQTTAQELLKQTTYRFYLSSINSDDEETTVAFGNFVDTTGASYEKSKTDALDKQIANLNSTVSSQNATIEAQRLQIANLQAALDAAAMAAATPVTTPVAPAVVTPVVNVDVPAITAQEVQPVVSTDTSGKIVDTGKIANTSEKILQKKKLVLKKTISDQNKIRRGNIETNSKFIAPE